MSAALPEQSGHIDYLCAAFGLGAAMRAPLRVVGGFHHRMWRLDTERGSFAVKQLASDADLSSPDETNRYNVAERVAEAFARRGVPALVALAAGGSFLQRVGGEGYLVYPWTDARAADRNHISTEQTLAVARLLAEMHRGEIDVPNVARRRGGTHPEEEVGPLIRQAVARNVHNARLLLDQLDELERIGAGQLAAIELLRGDSVISHGDLDHKNVLWQTDGRPLLIDWEAARWLNPTYETLLEGLDWSGITSELDLARFEGFLTAYRGAGGTIDGASITAAFDCMLGDWLLWMMYNLSRAVDAEDRERHRLGTGQVDLVLYTMMRLQRLRPRLLSITLRHAR